MQLCGDGKVSQEHDLPPRPGSREAAGVVQRERLFIGDDGRYSIHQQIEWEEGVRAMYRVLLLFMAIAMRLQT